MHVYERVILCHWQQDREVEWNSISTRGKIKLAFGPRINRTFATNARAFVPGSRINGIGIFAWLYRNSETFQHWQRNPKKRIRITIECFKHNRPTVHDETVINRWAVYMARNKVWTSGVGYRNTLLFSASLSRWMRRLVNCYRIFIIKLRYLYRKSYTECNGDKSMDRWHEEYAKWKYACDWKSFIHNWYLILWKSNNWS